jgi:hypothetical protein
MFSLVSRPSHNHHPEKYKENDKRGPRTIVYVPLDSAYEKRHGRKIRNPMETVDDDDKIIVL